MGRSIRFDTLLTAMSVKEQLQQDIKSAMLARDTLKTDVIKGLKSAILYAEVAAGKREEGLPEEEVLSVLKKESKKRAESAELYTKGNSPERAQKELDEKAIVDTYLPAQLSEEATKVLIEKAIEGLSVTAPTQQDMGKIIGAVKQAGGSEVDGALLARLVKERIGL